MTIIQRIKKIFTVIVYFASVSFRKNWKESSNYYTQKHHMDCIWVREFNSFHGWSEKKSDLHTYICRIILYYDIYFARFLQFRGNWKDFERYLQIICFKNSNNNVIISTLSGFFKWFFYSKQTTTHASSLCVFIWRRSDHVMWEDFLTKRKK